MDSGPFRGVRYHKRTMVRKPSPTPPSQPVTLAARATSPRADAVRNRARVLGAAQAVVARDGPTGLTMDDVAAAAGVGKGTVFRHFHDKTGLLRALLDAGEREFQQQILSGPPPLGPGAPAAERLQAFGPRLLAHRATNLALLVLADRTRPLESPVYRGWHMHVRMLVAEAAPSLDADVTAHMLLAAVSPALLAHLIDVREDAVAAMSGAWQDLVGGLTGA